MSTTLNRAQAVLFRLLVFMSLASCAAPVPQPVQSPQPQPNASAQPALARVVSIRPVTLSPEQPAEIAGVNAVLAALNLGTVSPPVTGEEIVIEKDDGNTASIAQQNQTTSLAAGDQIMLAPGDPVMVLRR